MRAYSTRDIYIASTLIALGHTNYSIEKNGKIAMFVFENDTNLPDETWESAINVDADQYYSEGYAVEPKKLFNAFKELKNRLFN